MAAGCGRERWRDERMFRVDPAGGRGALLRRLRARPGAGACGRCFLPARKVLVTDLDNTLWGGVVGEDGPDGILTGSDFPGNCYQEYQRLLWQLGRRGVCSRSARRTIRADVAEAFERRKTDLLLGLADFAAVEVGWGSKVQALQRIAQSLSLGLDSFVFVDDSPAECAEVRQSLPEVLVVQVPTEEPWRIAAAGRAPSSTASTSSPSPKTIGSAPGSTRASGCAPSWRPARARARSF